MTRKLASIQVITNIQPIKDSDNIEVATVLGWQCVVAKKDNFKVGDNVVYIEIDSIMPEKPEYEFLRARKFRVRTIRLRGQISQGLILPLSVLPKKKTGYRDDEDVTEILGVKKYDPQADLEARMAEEMASRQKNKIKKFLVRYSWFRRMFGAKKSGFPSFIHKTDEDRIQLFPNICEQEADTPFEVTEKLDGQSGTYFLIRQKGLFKKNKFTFGVCSRNLLLNKPNNSSYWTVARQYEIEKILKDLIGNREWIAIQGEIIGTGIQGNKYKVDGYEFYAFNLIYPEGKVDNYVANVSLTLKGIPFVPILANHFYLLDSIDEMIKFSNGVSLLNPETLREGVVLRNYKKNISFKVVSPEFLLKYGE